ncbi:MAG: metallophosphoesterase [candidate division NC10 bacterium]
MRICCRLLSSLLLPLFLWGCSSSSDSQPLTVSFSIQTSQDQEALATVSPPREIILSFSEPLLSGTVPGNVSLQVVKTSGAAALTSPVVEVVTSAEAPHQVLIRTRDGAPLPSGEKYKLVVGSGVRGVSGAIMLQEYTRYFATDYDFARQSLDGLGDTRTITVVISDLHLGDQRSIDEGYGWTIKNRAKLVGFLKMLRQQPNIKELAIAGDLFDEWVAPMDYDTFNGATESGFVDMIVTANGPVFDALNDIIRDGLIAVIYVPGNHDMLAVSADLQRVFPGITEARDAQGLGAYTPAALPEVVIEHGHRYDFFNAPDPISNRDITKTDSILSPGFFVSKIATTSDLETGVRKFYREALTGQYGSADTTHYFSYWVAWQLIMSQKPVKESWDAKIIKTAIDGYSALYAINDLIPQYDAPDGAPLDVLLYKDIVNTWWDMRQTSNMVPVKILADVAIAAGAINLALDAQSTVQYFLNSSSNKRIVVFGHTHKAKLSYALDHQLHWSIYANSGAWVDVSDNPTCTFVTIIPQKANGATTETVTVYQYSDDTTITKIASGAISN